MNSGMVQTPRPDIVGQDPDSGSCGQYQSGTE